MDRSGSIVQQKDLIVKTLLNAVPNCQAVYLFGTWGTDAERPDSDVDIAVLPTHPLEPMRRWELAQALASLVGRDVDLVDLLAASTVLRLQVVANGELLYASPQDAVERFADTVFSSYARLNEERRGILDDVRRRGNVYGQ